MALPISIRNGTRHLSPMLLFKTITPVDYLFVAKHKKDYYMAFLRSTEKR